MKTQNMIAALVICISANVSAEDFSGDVTAFLQTHCVRCHGDEVAEGELNLASLKPDFSSGESTQKWVEVLDRVNLGEMPPEDEPPPSEEELGKLVDWISHQLRSIQAASEGTGGRVLLRRLTRREYANTVRDLLSVTFVPGKGPMDLLPPDGSIRGFDRNSNALFVDPSLLDAYLEMAEKVAEQAIRFRPPLVAQRTMRFEFRDTIGSPMDYLIDRREADIENGRMVLMSGDARTFGKLRHPFDDTEIPVTAKYRVRIQASAEQGSDGAPVYMSVRQGPGESFGQVRVDAPVDQPEVYEFLTTRDALFQGEFNVGIVPGTDFRQYVQSRGPAVNEAKQAFEQGKLLEATRMKARMRAQGDFDTNIRGAFRDGVMDLNPLPKLHLDWIEVIGPLQESYPPESMTRLFPGGWDSGAMTVDAIRKAMTRLLPRAYRRPVAANEIDQIMNLVQADVDAGHGFERAIRTGVVTILCSPHFLYLYESADGQGLAISEGTARLDESSRALTPLEFASRLSYFLWSSKPDDELFATALRGNLREPETLAKTVDRMLDDSRVEGFVDGFVRQWLKVNEFHRFPADEKIFPEYYATEFVGIDDDITEQPLALVREILKSDESVLVCLDSDWTMLNERLAAFYQIDGVRGDEFQRVSLDPDTHAGRIRGGLLGMAGVHRWGSDGSRTKPVERGKYVLDVLFNDPPPPPPPNAGEVEPNLRGQVLTVRQRLKKHREQTTCNHCHRRIDPYGLALENFNVVGQWREKMDGEKPIGQWGDDRPVIDSSGRLPSGKSFSSYGEFKSALHGQQERFLRGLTEKLLMYALARTIEASDRVTVDEIVTRAKEENSTLRSLIRGVVMSDAFGRK